MGIFVLHVLAVTKMVHFGDKKIIPYLDSLSFNLSIIFVQTLSEIIFAKQIRLFHL